MSAALLAAMRPVSRVLSDLDTEDLAIQEPGVGWWLKGGAWHRLDLPEMTYARLHGLSVLAAAQTRQRISPQEPILSADLPGSIRLQAVMPPAVPPGTMALTFRRGDERLDEVADVERLFDTGRWNRWDDRHERRRAQDAALLDRFDAGDLPGFLLGLAQTRRTGLFCGATGAGKSRLSKLLGGAIPEHERIIAIEDAAELVIRQPNHVRHFYSATGTGPLTPAALMKAALRERPHRILLGEMRDAAAAAVFIEEVMSGHPGSLSTIHGANPPEAARRLFSLFKSSHAGQSMRDETVIATLAAAVDFIIPVENDAGRRAIGEVWFKPHAARRGQSFSDLLGEA